MSLKTRILAWLGIDRHQAEIEVLRAEVAGLRGALEAMAKASDEKFVALTQAARKSDANVLNAALNGTAEMIAASQTSTEALRDYVKEVTDIIAASGNAEVN